MPWWAWTLLGLALGAVAMVAWGMLIVAGRANELHDQAVDELEAQEQTRPNGNVHRLRKDDDAA